MSVKNYENLYKKQIFNNIYPQNVITRLFLSRFSIIKKNFKGKKILDFSCGIGPYLNFFKDLKMKVYATEISDKILNNLKKKYNKIVFKKADTDKIYFKKNFFDIFFAYHSIYYLNHKNQNYEETLMQIRKILKKNGLLIFTIPNLKQKHISYKKYHQNIYYASKDIYNLRQKSFFYLFKNAQEIKQYFSKFFKLVHIGEVRIKCKNLDENYYICIFKK